MDKNTLRTNVRNVEAQCNHQAAKLAQVIDNIKNASDKYHIKEAIRALDKAKKHIRAAIVGIENR